VIIITAKNVYSAPDCASPAIEITELILKKLAGADGEGTRESTNSNKKAGSVRSKERINERRRK
jgi:hypothetical protein